MADGKQGPTAGHDQRPSDAGEGPRRPFRELSCGCVCFRVCMFINASRIQAPWHQKWPRALDPRLHQHHLQLSPTIDVVMLCVLNAADRFDIALDASTVLRTLQTSLVVVSEQSQGNDEDESSRETKVVPSEASILD